MSDFLSSGTDSNVGDKPSLPMNVTRRLRRRTTGDAEASTTATVALGAGAGAAAAIIKEEARSPVPSAASVDSRDNVNSSSSKVNRVLPKKE